MNISTARPEEDYRLETQFPLRRVIVSISTRELLMLQDHLSVHATMAEKVGFYAGQVTDPQIRQVLVQLQRGHQRHVDSLVQHIEGAASSVGFGASIGQTAGISAQQLLGGGTQGQYGGTSGSQQQSQYTGPIQQYQV